MCNNREESSACDEDDEGDGDEGDGDEGDEGPHHQTFS